MTRPREASGPRRFRFGRNRRLLKRKDFQRVYRQGRKAHGRYATVFCLQSSGEDGGHRPAWRLGITSTRQAGKAHDRNRQRRLVREYFRLNQAWLPEGWEFVVNTKRELSRVSFNQLSADLSRTLRRLGFDPPASRGPEIKTRESDPDMTKP